MRWASLRRAAAAGIALAIPLLCIGCDVLARGTRPVEEHPWTYASGVASSLGMWVLGMDAARHPKRPVRVFALAWLGVTAAFGLGLQSISYRFTHAYLGRRALVLALGIPSIARSSYVARDAAGIALACAAPAALVVTLAMFRARLLGQRDRHAASVTMAFAIAVLVTIFAPHPRDAAQAMPPDALWLHGLGGPLLYAMGLEAKPKSLPVGHHMALPPDVAAAPQSPSIVLIVGESLRRDAICAEVGGGSNDRKPLDGRCSPSPALDAAAPHRIGFARAFSPASCTELATTALWTGLSLTSPLDSLAGAPLLWDWAKARGFRSAYVTSQNLLFQGSDHFLRGSRIDFLREARDFAVDAPIDDGSADEALTEVALSFLERDGPPALLVIHHANTHVPYRQAAGAPPSDDVWVRYQSSLARNDALLGDLMQRLRAGQRGRSAIVIYVSDHGEAFGEHGGSYHSFDLHAEQVDVPLWVDAPEGALPAAAEARLRAEAATRPVVHADVSATVIDLVGGLDVTAYENRARALAGRSLLRDAGGAREVFLWNCPPTRECASEAFAVVSFPLKLQWIGNAQRYECDDLVADPHELAPLDLGRCGALRSQLDGIFGARGRSGHGLAPRAAGD